MRIQRIDLSWFRGAAAEASLPLKCKSAVVYGENGSGKSSFVDAVEYVLQGKIGHLSHEYSGSHQSKGILNTHTPDGSSATVNIEFEDGRCLAQKTSGAGTSRTNDADGLLDEWDYRRTILRQDEVAAFITDTKGQKYSALLPLLGLGDLEIAANNLKQLRKAVERQSRLKELEAELSDLKNRRRITFGEAGSDAIREIVDGLFRTYVSSAGSGPTDADVCRSQVMDAIDEKLSHLSEAQNNWLTLQRAGQLPLEAQTQTVLRASADLAAHAGPLVQERLAVLEASRGLAENAGDDTDLECPACGRLLPLEDFRAHVRSEVERLRETIRVSDSYKNALNELADVLARLKTNLTQPAVAQWRAAQSAAGLEANLTFLDGLELDEVRRGCSAELLADIDANCLPLINAAKSGSEREEPDAEGLNRDRKTIEIAALSLEARETERITGRAHALLAFLAALETGVRQEIASRSQGVIDEISGDIKMMWAVLHAGKTAVEDVRLYQPNGSGKAIDIGLKFYGVDQDSPRLTLSEGNRNGLGLCIFLAMAMRKDVERPLLLDDVIVSLDRNHRGKIVKLLKEFFSDRQVIVFTHDRDWFTELRQQLGDKQWRFHALLPYRDPKLGIRWSQTAGGLEDARAQAEVSPHAGGNAARKIMDTELALRAERLKVRLPYRHREKNDHRTAHDFLAQLISDGQKCFERTEEDKHVPFSEAIEAWRETDTLLMSWGNKASHSFDVTAEEIFDLIDSCEKALKLFECNGCGKPVYKLEDASAKAMQCMCSQLRWRYGKV